MWHSCVGDYLLNEVKLYDPARKPASWMRIIQPGQCAVFHQDLKSAAELSPQGKVVTNPTESVCCIFDSLPEARRYCEQKVEQHPSMRCEVYDSAGKAKPPLLVVVNTAMRRHVEDSESSGHWRIGLGYLLIAASLPLFWWDWRSRGELILPSIVGVNFVFIGLRLLLWGYGTLHKYPPHSGT